jgi:ribonuclease P protein component
VVRAEDYRRVVRRGRRFGAKDTMTYVINRDDDGPVRFGLIVAKNVGNAVVRNRVRRRLKAACYAALNDICPGFDLVVRALPGSADASWVSLRGDVFGVVARAGVKR